MEGKWTKGPWRINPADAREVVADNEVMVICRTPLGLYMRSAGHNARLIAQAPAMAKALEKVARFLWEEGYTTVNPIVAEVDALLTAIKGE